ncbi:MAG: hypothetical protein ABIG30_03140 [Candidatus Aenigmatarchaeota archaeon]
MFSSTARCQKCGCEKKSDRHPIKCPRCGSWMFLPAMPRLFGPV